MESLLAFEEYNSMQALDDGSASLLGALNYVFMPHERNADGTHHRKDIQLILYQHPDGQSQLIAPARQSTNVPERKSTEAPTKHVRRSARLNGTIELAADAFWRTGTALGVRFRTGPTDQRPRPKYPPPHQIRMRLTPQRPRVR